MTQDKRVLLDMIPHLLAIHYETDAYALARELPRVTDSLTLLKGVRKQLELFLATGTQEKLYRVEQQLACYQKLLSFLDMESRAL